MQTWVELLSHQVGISNSSLTAPALQQELQRFTQFYGNMDYGPFRLCLGAAQPAAGGVHCQHALLQSADGGNFADPDRVSFKLDVRSTTVRATFDFSKPVKYEALIRMMIVSTTVFCMVFVSLSLDHVAEKLIVTPLRRLLPTVRQVMAELRAKFPSLEQQGDEEERDEVAAFEEMVSKITLIVTAANANAMETQGPAFASEWINGIATKASPKHTDSAVDEQRVLARTVTSDVPFNDASRLERLGLSYDLLDSWSFDVLALETPKLTGVAAWLLLDTANPYLALQPQTVAVFLDAMEQEYRKENPYHNWRHACDVLHGVFRGCLLGRALDFAARVDVLALLVAAVGHDAGHPGLNNVFLVQTSHELALRYNDLSPLENMHCSTMFGVLSSRPEANVFGVLTREQYREARQVCIETILHTDNAKHFDMVKELQLLYHKDSDVFEVRGAGFPSEAERELLQQVGNRRLALQALLHGADISNPCRPWTICEAWAGLVLGEFFLQGDREKQLGVPVQMLNNRDTVSKPSSQVAFIEFFIYPFNTALVKIFPPLWGMSENLHANIQRWQAMRTPDEREKTGQKIQTVCEELRALIQGAKEQMGPPSQRGESPPGHSTASSEDPAPPDAVPRPSSRTP